MLHLQLCFLFSLSSLTKKVLSHYVRAHLPVRAHPAATTASRSGDVNNLAKGTLSSSLAPSAVTFPSFLVLWLPHTMSQTPAEQDTG